MNAENYISKNEITREMANNIDNLESLIDLGGMIIEDDNDKANLENIKYLYSNVLLDEFKSTLKKVIRLEKFYQEFHKDIE